MEKILTYKKHEYRIRQMNAIEIMALRAQVTFEDYEKTEKFYKMLLENMEVKINDKWLPVKEKGREIYYPDKIQEDVNAIEVMLAYFLEYLKMVFQKSNESKQTQE